jgi:hypothetical protein
MILPAKSLVSVSGFMKIFQFLAYGMFPLMVEPDFSFQERG